MYMGVILWPFSTSKESCSIPHVYGGDPLYDTHMPGYAWVFPMYMGVIPMAITPLIDLKGIPHVYGGDP